MEKSGGMEVELESFLTSALATQVFFLLKINNLCVGMTIQKLCVV
jgi:hypothetical protein